MSWARRCSTGLFYTEKQWRSVFCVNDCSNSKSMLRDVTPLTHTWFWGSRVWFWPSGAWLWLSLPPTGDPRVVAVMLDVGQIFAILSDYVAGAGRESTRFRRPREGDWSTWSSRRAAETIALPARKTQRVRRRAEALRNGFKFNRLYYDRSDVPLLTLTAEDQLLSSVHTHA